MQKNFVLLLMSLVAHENRRFDPGDTVSAVELTPGAASYLPLRSWEDADAVSSSAHDPLVGVLGALDALPEGVRVISQVALLPAPVNWSHRDQRKAIEHALEPERQQERRAQIAQQRRPEESAPGLSVLLIGSAILLALIGYPQWKTWVPASWLQQVTIFAQSFIAPQTAQQPLKGMSFSLPLLIGLGLLCALCRCVSA